MIFRDITTHKAGKVLVINSDPEISRILEVNLEHANLDIVSARNGTEALSKIQNDISDLIILDPALPDMEDTEIYRQIKDSPQTSRIPIILISAKLPGKNRVSKPDDVPIYYVTKPFNPKEVVALVQGYLMHKERAVSINQLTGLPNRIQVGKEIDRLIQQKTPFATIYIVMDDLRGINKTYGYSHGDRVVQLLADVVFEATRLFGNPQDLAGYFGGGKFVIVSTPWKARVLCRRIISDYHKRIKSPYADEYLQTSPDTDENSSAGKGQSPNMSIHIAMVTNQKQEFEHHLEVIESGTEQIEYLRRFPESNCYFDISAEWFETSQVKTQRRKTPAHKVGIQAMQGVLAWFDFLTREMDIPMNMMKDCLGVLETLTEENLKREHLDNLKTLHDNYHHLKRVFEGITSLAKSESLKSNGYDDEVDVASIINWVIEHVQELLEQRRIKVETQTIGDISRIIRDKQSLAQSLFHIVRSEIHSSPPGSRLVIRLTDLEDEYICIEISNPERHIPARTLNSFLKRQFDTAQKDNPVNELYPAQMMISSLGGELDVTSDKKKGIVYKITVPKKWRSWMPEVNTLQLAMEISRKEAREALKNIRRIILSLQKDNVPLSLQNNLEQLSSKIQEMGVLCNRSLFLTDDLNNRLDAQQDRLLQQEIEQVATLEVMLTICREIARFMQVDHHFNPESAKRVASFSLSIASKFRMSESDRQTLRYAALFKDLGVALTPKGMSNEFLETTVEDVAAIKERYDLLWKSLSTIHYLSPALDFIQYRYERYDGTGGRFGIKGTDIPLGSRILALADTFDHMTSDRSGENKISPELAMEKIIEDSGSRFDPDVVNTFLLLWKRNELELAAHEN